MIFYYPEGFVFLALLLIGANLPVIYVREIKQIFPELLYVAFMSKNPDLRMKDYIYYRKE